jgi:hypothetical protein
LRPTPGSFDIWARFTSSIKANFIDRRDWSGTLEQVIRGFGIKSILNVRGEASGESWYENEIFLSKNLHLTHFDYGLSASDRVMIGPGWPASGRGQAEMLFLPEWLLRLLKQVKARQPHIRQIAFTETL